MRNCPKGAWPKSRDVFSNFGTRNISETARLKIKTSNFACGLILRDTKSKMKKMAKRGRGLGHVTYFSNFGTHLTSLELLKVHTSNFACWWNVRNTKSKMKNRPKDGVAYVT